MATQDQIDAGRIASPADVAAFRAKLIATYGSPSSFPEEYAKELAELEQAAQVAIDEAEAVSDEVAESEVEEPEVEAE